MISSGIGIRLCSIDCFDWCISLNTLFRYMVVLQVIHHSCLWKIPCHICSVCFCVYEWRTHTMTILRICFKRLRCNVSCLSTKNKCTSFFLKSIFKWLCMKKKTLKFQSSDSFTIYCNQNYRIFSVNEWVTQLNGGALSPVFIVRVFQLDAN